MLKDGAELDIRTIPSVVAGDPKNRNGIILAKSDLAKGFGIKTAMTLYEAQRRANGTLEVYPPDHAMYARYSDEMYALLTEYSDVVERFSVDECFVDYTGSEGLFGSPREAAEMIRERIKAELGFTVNIGVSENKFLAKTASDFEKPDKVHLLYRSEVATKLWKLPAGDMFGVGRATAGKLAGAGLLTIGDVARTEPAVLTGLLGSKAQGEYIHRRANGIDDEPVVPAGSVAAKSVGNSTTTPQDVTSRDGARRYLLGLAESVGGRLRRKSLRGSVVTVTLRNTIFRTYSHQMKLPAPISSADEIYEAALALFDTMWRGDDLRLLGISVAELTTESYRRITLFDAALEKTDDDDALAEVTDRIREKYGKTAIKRATFIDKNNDEKEA
jgi:DNA polymerase-4